MDFILDIKLPIKTASAEEAEKIATTLIEHLTVNSKLLAADGNRAVLLQVLRLGAEQELCSWPLEI